MTCVTDSFPQINRGYDSTFQPERLSLGLVVPITAYPDSPVPDMTGHLARVQRAEALGFRAVWLLDVPFDVPSFGDAGQLYNPFAYLGYLAGQTTEIALGVASIVLPLRHPAHVAKAAASVDPRALAGELPMLDMEAYAQSKLAITLWNQAFGNAHPSGPVSLAVNPGSLLATRMVREGFGTSGNDLNIGVDILTHAALSDEFAQATGRYYDNDAQRIAPRMAKSLSNWPRWWMQAQSSRCWMTNGSH